MAQQGNKNVCRVCLRSDLFEDQKGLSLFQTYRDSLISEHINTITTVGIKQNDGLPEKICPECLLELDTVINFKRKCETSNSLLLHTNNINEENNDVKGELDANDVKLELKTEDFKNGECEEECLDTEYLDESFDNTCIEVDIPPKPSKSIDLKLICHDCGGSFRTKCKLRVHWKKVHLYEALICQICKRTFKSYKALNRHVKAKLKSCLATKNVTVQGTGKSRLFLCKECPYSSRRFKDVNCHYLTHSGERPVKCRLCDKKYTQLSSMEGHMENAHGIYKVEITCQYCGKIVRGRNRVYKHLQRHTAQKCQCDICKKMFRSKKSLIMHMVRHTGVKSYTCEKCAISFFTLSELCNHKRHKHSLKQNWYKCKLCDYRSHSIGVVNKHQVKHSGLNIYCSICRRFFDNTLPLAQHVLKHTETEKKFHCLFCDKKYFKKDSLSKHMKIKHKELLPHKPVLVKNELNKDDGTSAKIKEK